MLDGTDGMVLDGVSVTAYGWHGVTGLLFMTGISATCSVKSWTLDRFLLLVVHGITEVLTGVGDLSYTKVNRNSCLFSRSRTRWDNFTTCSASPMKYNYIYMDTDSKS